MVTTVDLNIQMVDLYNQYKKIKPEIDKRFEQIFKSSAYINGPFVHQFCQNLSTYLQVKHVLPCANGTDALTAALMALNLPKGSEVITTPFTFVATAESIALLGLKPIFVDIESDTFNIDPAQVEAAITPQTKCILPVHLYGQCANMQSIMQIAAKHKLYVVEDTAQAIGADYCNKSLWGKAGTIGHIGTTSFYPSKNLGAYGDAGAIFTNDDKLAQRLTAILNHGQVEKYYSNYIGLNSRLDSFQAAVLDIKLKKLDEYTNERRKVAEFYDTHFKDNELCEIPYRAPYSNHVFHQYTLKVKGDRDKLRNELNALNIPSMIYYPYPLHLHKAYEYLGYKKGDFPISEVLAEQTISLPMHSELTNEQLTYICNSFLSVLPKVQ